MNGFKHYDDWKLETPEDERFRYGDTGELIEPEDERDELECVYDDLHAAQALIREMRTVLKCADSVITHYGADAQYEIIKMIRSVVAKAEEASK